MELTLANMAQNGFEEDSDYLGLTVTKEENFAEWYSQVITKGELIEYHNVPGTYVLRPWSYSIWKAIEKWFSAEIEKLGLEDCYPSMFLTKEVMDKWEETSPTDTTDTAYVTKVYNRTLPEPIAIAATSERILYQAYPKWIKTERDLPLKLNVWTRVLRWEKVDIPFVRSKEFLWQEGHTMFATETEAVEDAQIMIDLYEKVYNELLAVPVVKGRKTDKEKAMEAVYSLTVEAYIPTGGRGVQAATSHYNSQFYSKIFDIAYTDTKTKERKYGYQATWGMTTRTIGVMIMTHSDNRGLVLPPKVSPVQVIIIPVTDSLPDNEREILLCSCRNLESKLTASSVKVKGDYRDYYSSTWKDIYWELKGVPIRVEMLAGSRAIVTRRDTCDKLQIAPNLLPYRVVHLLEEIHDNLLKKATAKLHSHIILLRDWSMFVPNLNKGNIILTPFCGEYACEKKIKRDTNVSGPNSGGFKNLKHGAKSMCIPFEQPGVIEECDKCIHPECNKKPQFFTLFGRPY